VTATEAIEQLLQGTPLSREHARTVMDQVMAGEATSAQIAGLLIALRARGETVEEMTGFVESMRAHATPLDLPPGSIDTCGTGGDRAGTFNISTAAALVGAPGLGPLMISVLSDLGHERALVFYGEDGLDELTTTGSSRVFQLRDGKVEDFELDPSDLGLGRARAEELKGGTPPENAAL